MWWLKPKTKPREEWTDERKQFSRFYHSKEWLKLRQYKLAVDALCECCLSGCSHLFDNPNRREVLTDGWAIDHKIPLALDYSLRLNYDNLQTLCLKCHSYKTSVLDFKMKIDKKIDDNHQRLNDFD